MAAPQVPFAPAEALPQLDFAVVGARAARFSAAPTIEFTLVVEADVPVRSIVVNAQIQIAPTLRGYSEDDEGRLLELFGTRERWSNTLRGFLWTNAVAVVPPFTGRVEVDLRVPCSYDLDVAASKFFHALADGDVPLAFLYSGTVFYTGDGGLLRTTRISSECESAYRLPVRVWREAIDNHFPNSAWLRVHREVFDRLVQYKAKRTLPTWDAALEELLAGRDA